MKIKMNKDEQFASTQIILNFYKDNEITFDSLDEARDVLVETWNNIFEGENTISSYEDLDEEVLDYYDVTIEEHFIVEFDNDDEYVEEE